jgi:methionine--tRNA ligase beta chain
MITYDDFKKVEIRAGKILSAEKVPDTDKLLKLSVDFGEKTEVIDEAGNKNIKPSYRQIISGIALYFPDTSKLVGKICMFVTNLEPRIIRGLESNGMILAVSTPAIENGKPIESGKPSEGDKSLSGSTEMGSMVNMVPGGFSLLEPNDSIPPGTCAK